MTRFSRNTPPAPPVVERNPSPVVFDPIPQEERRPESVDMDDIINEQLKRQMATASIISHLYKTKPRVFKIICMHCDVDYLELYEWAKEKLRCT